MIKFIKYFNSNIYLCLTHDGSIQDAMQTQNQHHASISGIRRASARDSHVGALSTRRSPKDMATSCNTKYLLALLLNKKIFCWPSPHD
jgi:hypothetical protein